MPVFRRSTVLAATIAAASVLALSAPLSASAHVTLADDTAAPGSYALLELKVPNESATATTTSVSVALPTKTALDVSYVPVPGWSAKLVTTKLDPPVTVGDDTLTEAVSQVTWTTDAAHGIAAGQLQLFPISLGPIPDVDSISFPVTQTYSDGTVVSWSDSGEDAEHPAPVLYIDATPPADSHQTAAPSISPTPTPDAAAASANTSIDVVARILGVAGLVVGAVGLVIAIGARRRKETP